MANLDHLLMIPCWVRGVKKLFLKIIDIHSQHENLLLNNEFFN